MWMRGLQDVVRVRCPHCSEPDWRTQTELNEGRPFTCYMCLCLSPRPSLATQGVRSACAARLAHFGSSVTGLFRRRSDNAPV